MKALLLLISLQSVTLLADSSSNTTNVMNTPSAETYTIEGKTFDSKAAAIRYVISAGHPVIVNHSRCEILTNRLSFKACPKNKVAAFDNEQFKSLNVNQ